MKYIPLRNPEGSQFKSRVIISTVIGQSPNQALTLLDMRVRAKVLDKLDAVPEDGDHLLLEDAEWETLRGCANKFPWSVFHRDLLQVLEDIEGAVAPPLLAPEARGEEMVETAPLPGLLAPPNGKNPRSPARSPLR